MIFSGFFWVFNYSNIIAVEVSQSLNLGDAECSVFVRQCLSDPITITSKVVAISQNHF